jgi:hypothetical protein
LFDPMLTVVPARVDSLSLSLLLSEDISELALVLELVLALLVLVQIGLRSMIS